MTNHDAPASNARVLDLARQIHLAIQDVPLAGSGTEIADALQLIAVSAAEQVVGPRDIARTLMTLAERYLKKDAPERGEPQTCTEAAHKALTAAAQILEQEGIPGPEIREMMLAFAAGWMMNAEGPRQAASVLYRHADVLAGRSETQH